MTRACLSMNCLASCQLLIIIRRTRPYELVRFITDYQENLSTFKIYFNYECEGYVDMVSHQGITTHTTCYKYGIRSTFDLIHSLRSWEVNVVNPTGSILIVLPSKNPPVGGFLLGEPPGN